MNLDSASKEKVYEKYSKKKMYFVSFILLASEK